MEHTHTHILESIKSTFQLDPVLIENLWSSRPMVQPRSKALREHTRLHHHWHERIRTEDETKFTTRFAEQSEHLVDLQANASCNTFELLLRQDPSSRARLTARVSSLWMLFEEVRLSKQTRATCRCTNHLKISTDFGKAWYHKEDPLNFQSF